MSLLRYAPLRELVLTRLREFIREPEAIFWVYVFPVLLAVGLGLAFRSTPDPELRAGVVSGPGATAAADAMARFVSIEAGVYDEEEGRRRLASGKIDVLVRLAERSVTYIYDPARSESLLARERIDRALQRAAGRADPLAVTDEHVSEPGSRYIDFLLPGLMGMNLLGGGIWGVGFFIVDMRVRKLLKRFMATPMRPREFFAAILASRILFLVPEMLFLFGIATLGFGMPFRGDPWSLMAVVLLSALCFAGLGLLISTRARKLETLSGLANLVILPMWLLSGIFFSSDRFPDFMQPLIHALPLTSANDALRAIILDGENLWSQSVEMAILGAWTAASFLLSFKFFRWR